MSAQRHNSFQRIRDNGAFDVIVIGGGINGLGVYRELAVQGLRVLLVERKDFCSGCSAAPSRMIHGGLRYLENGEFDLVRESLAERDALLRNAPHMVRPLPTTIPITSLFSGLFNAAASFFGGSGKPSNRGALPIKAGLTLYDLVTRKRRILPKHKFRSAKSTWRQWPNLTRKLLFSATYYDAWISHPERLGVELITDTEKLAPDSVAVNYAELNPMDGAFSVTDRETGDQLPVTARAVVNASGAWLDEVIAQLSPQEAKPTPLVSGTKGSHLILENPALLKALDGHMMYFENTDGRVCIVFPYLGKVLAGSTDIRVTAASRTRCEPEEMDYILTSLRLIFPDVPVSEDEVVFSYSGIRPLPSSDHDFTGRISRGHFTHKIDGTVPQFCMVGGKWTTFRAFAQQTADEVLAELDEPRKRDTIDLPIGGGADYPAGDGAMARALMHEFSPSADRAEHLVQAYGTRSRELMRYSIAGGDDQTLASDCPYTASEIRFLVQREHVVHLSDIVLRRTDLAITGRLSLSLIDTIADLMAKDLDWNQDQMAAERATLLDELVKFHGVLLSEQEPNAKSRRMECV
ncbi:glycerol-3-phosphate dehydrogenase/oxidase [Parasedimentitalea maritima]|uniref:Glycerol-3-phosphate dehydrogenase/oxidase n=1 Tax=Parasedimentitalea maritima TaxID=2578117 RepID=A0ABY2UYP6_9RHOB|nr:glycerol-3-phosphate dehydrogenase/oxidase [Zongyanglinia marina]TLP68006.1 glycerol-3-phosphate dehydrogenase/oxidase [Zongyanglinia marina]